MPLYNFSCKKCDHQYEELTPIDDKGKYPKVKCPACGSKKKVKIPSLTARAIFTDKTGTSKMENFGYRAGYNMEQAQDCRRAAESKSHVGSMPYDGIDDIQSGKYFSEVK